MNRILTISQLAELTGVPPKTIRYYESRGVLPLPQRKESGYRVYSETDVRRLELIRRARVLDMSLPEVRELAQWAGSETCNDFQDHFLEVIHRKLEEVEHRIADLKQPKQDLQCLEAHLVESQKEAKADHTVLECSPETCRCLGGAEKGRAHIQEVKLCLNRPESRN